MSSETQAAESIESNVIDCGEKKNVVITGFGVFRDHQVNPSWEAIKEGQLHIERPNVNIIIKQLEVSYEEVDKVVCDLWDQYKPLLMVHIGLAAQENTIRIEQIARHGPYLHDDMRKTAPDIHLRHYDEGTLGEGSTTPDYACKPCKFDFSKTCLDVEKVCDKLNEAHREGKVALSFKKSVDGGLYVCEYTYQKSLKICDRTVFIHVPDIANYKLEDISLALKYAIEAFIDEVLNM